VSLALNFPFRVLAFSELGRSCETLIISGQSSLFLQLLTSGSCMLFNPGFQPYWKPNTNLASLLHCIFSQVIGTFISNRNNPLMLRLQLFFLFHFLFNENILFGSDIMPGLLGFGQKHLNPNPGVCLLTDFITIVSCK
jgi:hypothetical protein